MLCPLIALTQKKNLSVTDPVSRILDVLLRDTTPYVFQQTLYDESKRTPNSGHRRRLSQCTRGFSMFQVYIDHFEIVREEKGLKKKIRMGHYLTISAFFIESIWINKIKFHSNHMFMANHSLQLFSISYMSFIIF